MSQNVWMEGSSRLGLSSSRNHAWYSDKLCCFKTAAFMSSLTIGS